MGVGGSWVGVRGLAKDTVWETFGLRATGAPATDDAPCGVAGGALGSGWCVAIRDSSETYPLFEEEDIAQASRGAEVVYCTFEEHAMGASAEYWRDGVRVWSVEREMGGPYAPLNVSGEPPPSYTTRRKELFDRQEAEGGAKAGVDYIYDLPHDLAEELTGFRYEQSVERLALEVLAEVRAAAPAEQAAAAPAPQAAAAPAAQPPARKPWWKVW